MKIWKMFEKGSEILVIRLNTKKRIRNILLNVSGGTIPPVDGGWGEWSVWTDCSQTCGGGTHSRQRKCNNPVPAYDGEDCQPDDNEQEKICNTASCKLFKNDINSANKRITIYLAYKCEYTIFPVGPVNGGWGQWEDWSECSRSCGGGTKTRERLCDSPTPAHGGNPCDGENAGTDSCSNEACKLI